MENPKTIDGSELSPWTFFLNAMRAPMTRDRYQTKVAKFFVFIGIPGTTLEEKATTFANRGKNDINWAFSNILKFVYFQKERVDRKEITGATVRNYAKSIKLFCEMADIPIPWKKITRGLPRGKKYADDIIPTLEQLRKVVEYPDRRIKDHRLYDVFFRHARRSLGLSAMGPYKTNRQAWRSYCRQNDCLRWGGQDSHQGCGTDNDWNFCSKKFGILEFRIDNKDGSYDWDFLDENGEVIRGSAISGNDNNDG